MEKFIPDEARIQSVQDLSLIHIYKMLEAGLLDEAKAMYGKYQATSAQAIGHKELSKYLSGEAELETCIEKLKQESRHYAKRQITWFKRRQDAVHIIFDDDRNAAVKTVIDKCEDFLNG